MTDLATAEPESRSTTLEPDTPADPSGGGAPRTLETEAKEPAKPLSLRDTVAAAVKEDTKAKETDAADKPDADADKAKGAEKAEKGAEKQDGDKAGPDAKEETKGAERAPDGKFAAKQPEGDGDKSDAKPEAEKADKPNGHIDPPKNFLPDAKETWRNTPRAVQRDIQNAIQQHETEVTKYREAAERYEPIRQFDEHVRQNGRAGVHETLQEVAQLEDLMGKNPIAAVNQILLRAGPRKADGSPVNLFELAQFVVQSGQDGYNKIVQQQPAQNQQQPNVEVEELRQKIAQMEQQTIAATVIEPFKRDHPRYEELQDDIALFLKSGRVPTSLSPHERLAAAYDMAARINPASHANDAAEPEADPEPGRRADDDFSGSKSIKSAPGAVSADMEPERGGSIRDLLADEIRRKSRSS